MIFGPNSPELAAALQVTLKGALQRWLGDVIAVRSLDVSAVDSTLTSTLAISGRDSGDLQTATFTRSV